MKIGDEQKKKLTWDATSSWIWRCTWARGACPARTAGWRTSVLRTAFPWSPRTQLSRWMSQENTNGMRKTLRKEKTSKRWNLRYALTKSKNKLMMSEMDGDRFWSNLLHLTLDFMTQDWDCTSSLLGSEGAWPKNYDCKYKCNYVIAFSIDNRKPKCWHRPSNTSQPTSYYCFALKPLWSTDDGKHSALNCGHTD